MLVDMEEKSIESKFDTATRALAGSRFADIATSKCNALQWLKSGDPELKQACISVLTTNYPTDIETINALTTAQEDENPIVRSTARIYLVRHFRSIGDDSWRRILTDDVYDDQIDAPARISNYLEIVRLSRDTNEFLHLCERLNLLTIADIDWQLVAKFRQSASGPV